MNKNHLNQLRKEYMNVPIPEELDFIVKKALKENGVNIRRKNYFKRMRILAASIAASLVMIAVGINSSPAFAKTLLEVPFVGNIVKVMTINKYIVKEDTYDLDIEAHGIKGLENKDLENSLNEKYITENEKLYEQFIADMKDIKEVGGGHLGVNSGYVIKTDNDKILSIGRYVVNTVGSSSTVFKYDTIDKKREVLITLPSLFKNDKYVNVISKNIKKQMIEQHKFDDDKYYWVEGIEQNGFMELFEKISKEQSFYINSDSKLVISFDKYEVAPGSMGVVEFIIPTDILQDILVSNEYIK